MKTVPLQENGPGDHLSDSYFNGAIHNLVSLIEQLPQQQGIDLYQTALKTARFTTDNHLSQ